MRYIATGQIFEISDIHTYGKNKEKSKQTVVITTKNVEVKNRLEYCCFDAFSEELINEISDLSLEPGDSVNCEFQIIGRKVSTEGKNNYFENKELLSIHL
ncbi:MAG: hypothetical protein WC389_20265, partial [Lutibacter sp.]